MQEISNFMHYSDFFTTDDHEMDCLGCLDKILLVFDK